MGLSNYGFVPSTPASYASDEESEERFAFHLLVVTVALDDVLALKPMPAPSGALSSTDNNKNKNKNKNKDKNKNKNKNKHEQEERTSERRLLQIAEENIH